MVVGGSTNENRNDQNGKRVAEDFFQTIFVFLILPLCCTYRIFRSCDTVHRLSAAVSGSGNKIYYVWHEYDGPFRQIFTAEMNVDGTGWKAKRTSGQFDKVFPQLHVAGNKIYYVWQQPDATKNRQIWTAEMNIDGEEWKQLQETTPL